MATFVKAFVADHFAQRDEKEELFTQLTEEHDFPPDKVSEYVFGDAEFYKKEDAFWHGMITEEQYDAALELARKEFGDDMVNMCKDVLFKEKAELQEKQDKEAAQAKQLDDQEKNGKVTTRADATPVKAGLLPRLIKCNDQKKVIVHIPDEDTCKSAGLQTIWVKDDRGDIMALKDFEKDEKPEMDFEPAGFRWQAKMTPYALYSKEGMYKGDKVNEPWSADLRQDPDEDIKKLQAIIDEMEKDGVWRVEELPIEPKEEWLMESLKDEGVKAN